MLIIHYVNLDVAPPTPECCTVCKDLFVLSPFLTPIIFCVYFLHDAMSQLSLWEGGAKWMCEVQ